MPGWVVSLIALACTVTGALFGYQISQDRRITRLEERVRSLGQQLLSLPKRKSD
jgi:type VI protein secretion system component VasF